MPILDRFATPANLLELTEADQLAWSDLVKAIFRQFSDFPQFYDPTATDSPHTARTARIVWVAFPARLLRGATSERQRWALADSSREQQDEYCEWSVERNEGGKLTRVTFTSEVHEYWHHLAARDPDRLVALYRQFVNPSVDPAELFQHGRYVSGNRHNDSTQGRLAHLVQANNSLGAAVDLAAKATVLREDEHGPVTHKQALVRCARLGDEFRNSDPQIAAAVNDAAASGAEITLANPPGLYLDGLTTTGMATPDGTDPATFWRIERGDTAHALRASFMVPADLGYTVSDVRLGGRPIQFGAQLADRVRVRLEAIVKPAGHQPRRVPCEP